MSSPLIALVEKPFLKENPPQFRVGDTVDVRCRIVEGDRERIQTFSGVVIARRGSGVNAIFTVRRIVANEGVERLFLVHSPNVVDVVATRHGKTRRAKLYYLRKRIGKARKLREIRFHHKKAANPEPVAAAV